MIDNVLYNNELSVENYCLLRSLVKFHDIPKILPNGRLTDILTTAKGLRFFAFGSE